MLSQNKLTAEMTILGATPVSKARRLSRAQRQFLSDMTLTVILCVSAILTWQLLVSTNVISKHVLPLPSSIGPSLVELVTSGVLLENLLTTLLEAAFGFVIATFVGLALGGLIAEFRLVERIVYPYVIALQTMPKIALAPVLLVWFGFGLGSKIAVAAVIATFPVLVNTIAGLKGCDQGRLDVMRALGASRWDCFRMVKLPNALPFVFAGLSTAVMFALTGALVGEFVGAHQGLGYLIVQANNLMDIPKVFAVLIILCVLGTAAFGAMQYARRKFLYWAPNED